MTRLFRFLYISFALAMQLAQAQSAPVCNAISGAQITGRDLALAVPALASLSPDLMLGYAPMPGVQRIFPATELRKLAARYGLQAEITSPVCFAWPLHELSRETIQTALRKSLPGREVELEITDQCHSLVPEGELIFPIEGLSAQSSRSTLWNGYVNYSKGKRFSTWVQVRVTIHEEQVVATRPIHLGEVIESSAIKTVRYVGPLQQIAAIHQCRDAEGKCARRPIEAGMVLSEPMLSLPQDVERQQLVTVHVYCGAAHIETQGIAVESGYRGSVIKVRNPKTGRTFSAQIEDRGVVTVVPGGNVGLVVEDKKS